MEGKRLLEVAVYTVGIGAAVVVLSCWRLRYLFEAVGKAGLVEAPFSVWLPIALFAAMATYVVVLTSLVPKRAIIGSSILLFGMAAIMAVVRLIFDGIGPVVNETLAPFAVQQVALGSLLVGVRMQRFRLCNAAPGVRPPESSNSQFRIADLLLLTTAVAVCLSMTLPFDYVWLRGSGPIVAFTRQLGLCLCASSVAIVWAALSENWGRWIFVAGALAPLGALPAWFSKSMLLFDFYWYGLLTAVHAGFLLLALWLLRINHYKLIKLPRRVST